MKLKNIILKILILFIPFYFVRFSLGPIPTTLLEVAIYTAAVLFLIYGLFDLKNKKAIIIAGGIFVIAGLVSALASPDQISGLGLWKAYFFDGYLIFLMALSAYKSKEDFIDFIIYSGVLTSVLALLLFVSGTRTVDGRLYDLDRLSPNYLAMFLTPIFVLSLYRALTKKTMFYLVVAALILVSLYLTDSRGVIVALLGSAIIGFYYFLQNRNKSLAKISLIALLLLFFMAGYLVFKPDWSDHSRKATSSNVRYYIWQTSFEIISQKPILGVGLSNYQNYFYNLTRDRVNYPEYISPVALAAHNLFIELLAVSGVLGLASFLFFLYQSRFYKSENLPVSLAIFSIIFHSLVDTPFFRNDLAAIFWLLLALSVSIKRKDA